MGKPEETPATEEDFKLVGFNRFVRTNPRSDRFPVHSFHHIEFWTADATTAASRFSFSLGLPLAARSDLSTGNSVHSSLLLKSIHRTAAAAAPLSFLFTAPYPSHIPNSSPSLPSFDPARAHLFVSRHGGLAVRAIALSVSDAAAAFHISVANGAVPSFPPADLGHGFSLAEVELYGDVVLRFVSGDAGRDSSPGIKFLPGFEDIEPDPELDYGLVSLDHAVGNVPELAPVASYMKKFLGFHEFAEFTAEDVGTAESGLNSVVLSNNEETVLLPVNEPVYGTKRRSQIQTYLDHHGGPGVQHLALRSEDVISSLRRMKGMTRFRGFEFMPAPPPKYYEGVKRRAGDVLSDEQIRECQELGLLVDRDDQGVLVQIFTKPIGDRY